MKRILMSIGLLLTVLCTKAEERAVTDDALACYKNNEAREMRGKKPGLDTKTRAILAQFASIVMGFLGILQDPNNAANVSSHVTDMVNNAVNIVTEAVKTGDLSLHATEQDLQEFARKNSKRLINIQ